MIDCLIETIAGDSGNYPTPPPTPPPPFVPQFPATTPDKKEPNNSFSSAKDIGRIYYTLYMGERTSPLGPLTIHSPTDKDFFKFNPIHSGLFKFTSLDGATMTIYNGYKKVIGVSQTTLTLDLVNNRIYYIMFSNALPVNYSFRIEKI